MHGPRAQTFRSVFAIRLDKSIAIVCVGGGGG